MPLHAASIKRCVCSLSNGLLPLMRFRTNEAAAVQRQFACSSLIHVTRCRALVWRRQIRRLDRHQHTVAGRVMRDAISAPVLRGMRAEHRTCQVLSTQCKKTGFARQ